MTKILLVCDHYSPEIGSAAILFYEMANELRSNGHDVHVLTTHPRPYNLNNKETEPISKIFYRERIDGIDTYRVKGFIAPKDNITLRGLEHFTNPAMQFFYGLSLDRPEIIIVYSPPLPLALVSIFLGKIWNSKTIINIQDLYPQTVIDVGMMKSRVMIKFFKMMERFIYKKSEWLTLHSSNNVKYAIENGADSKKTSVVHNWMDVGFSNYVERKEEIFGTDIRGKFVVSYAGVMAAHQGLEFVLDAAKSLEKEKDILFIFSGDGLAKEKLLERASRLELSNLLFVPFQPVNIYRELLACSDVSLVCLSSDIATPVIPRKLMSIMASGVPVIACVPRSNDTADVVKESNCGIVCDSGDIRGLSDSIISLYNDKDLRVRYGNNGRTYAIEHFTVQASVRQYEQIIEHIGKSKQND